MSLQLYTGTNIAKQLQDNDLLIVENVNITVKDATTNSLAALWLDKEGTTPIVNPFVSNTTGQFFFYILSGRYNITIEKNGSTGQVYTEIGTSGEVSPVDITSAAFSVSSDDHGTLFNVFDITGNVVITVLPVAADKLGSIIFIHSNTDSPVQIVPDAGVAVNTAYSLNLYAKFSTVALMSTAVNTWSLMGDIE